jgi:xanthine/CO dehydrogenase XdhC/CoxF family maturation factor
MSTKRIIEAFDQWRGEGSSLVLATICHTEGSTYSKAGHRILIADNGDYQGLVSGGCLEGDLAEHARTVITSGRSKLVTYDMRDEVDDLWGLGIGCNGLIQVLLQRLEPASDYEPFLSLARIMRNGLAAVCATVVNSSDETLAAGATLIVQGDEAQSWQVPQQYFPVLREHALTASREKATQLLAHDRAGGQFTVLYALVRPLPRILVLGAGLDAVPLVEMANQLGWLVTIADHRPAYLDKGDFTQAQAVLCIEAAKLTNTLDLSQFSAVVVMSHHLATDLVYLRQLTRCAIPYIGLLGPRDRRERLLADLGSEAGSLRERLRGPVGLDIGADSPESIALSIVAEIHAVLAGQRS